MAFGKWLLVLFFCYPHGLVTADYLANRTVEDDVKDKMESCSELFEKDYNKSLPYNDTNFSDLTNLNWIFWKRPDAGCYHVLVENSSLMVEERLAQANETGIALGYGWKMSRDVFPSMYCAQREAKCDWNVGNSKSWLGLLGRYFQSLDAYLTSIYDGLLAAIDEARGRLAAGEAPEQYKDVCTRANITVLICEILRIARMFGENCSDPKFELPPRCSWPHGDTGLSERPVEAAGWKKGGCWWPRIPGEFDSIQKIHKFARFLCSRLLHLVVAQGICGGAQEDDGLSDALTKSISDTGMKTWERADQVYLRTGGSRVVNAVANDFQGLVWPASEDDAKQKYEQLKRKIQEAFVRDYGDTDDRAYLIFYPCKEGAFAMLRDVSTENALVFVRRPDVNVIVRKEEDGTCECNAWEREIEGKKDAIINAYKDAEGNTAAYRLQQVDKLFKWRLSDGGCFRAVVAIECAYKFTWLELGWTYFPAWHADYGFKPIQVRSESPLSPACADIVFVK